ncbi:hypothetical protein [Bradyrhizobium guangzhouense]|uniref:hypothetical protein n=1 Tax=Bradyrhizobium guangzhouense TaxID=1325095 RepID=UPI001009E3CF|nr:hypothetical protein [Bradyrhizobium guangzhouense]RXH15147.1 hypothetical protein EAS54_18840 [Bradyrhizobium guangzhouense]
MTSPVLEALLHAKVADIVDPPRSWGREEKLMFLQLPRPLQLYYDKREKERDRRIGRAMNEAADARKRLAEVEAKLRAREAQLAKIEEKNAEAKDVAA